MIARALLLSVLALALMPVSAVHAQDLRKGDEPSAQTEHVPSRGDDRQSRLNRLFDGLAHAANAEEAERFESGIEGIWSNSGSDTADLLTSRALEMVKAENADGALTLLDAVVNIEPDFAEGWNKRATVYFLKGDYSRAMRDIRETLKREPRHYDSWAGLGRILEQSGDDRRALDAYRRALAIHPQMDGLKAMVDKLAVKVRGSEL